MVEVIVEVDLDDGQILHIRKPAAICSAPKPPVRCKLEGNLADSISAGGVYPDRCQSGRQPAENIIRRLIGGLTGQHPILDGGVNLADIEQADQQPHTPGFGTETLAETLDDQLLFEEQVRDDWVVNEMIYQRCSIVLTVCLRTRRGRRFSPLWYGRCITKLADQVQKGEMPQCVPPESFATIRKTWLTKFAGSGRRHT